ncbi:MAG: TIGR02301 family protein [Alphaproteobacteria bacterium]|nr:MAG: TIGR02301 family protein [Alphaproteobacteria bacterium]
MAVVPARAQAPAVEQEVRELPPAYEEEMLRLAEILGSLHYLRELCGAQEGQLWREQMQELLDKEEPTAERRARLIARFNRGYRGYREIHRECTPAAAEAANRYLRQGIRIAAEIPNRYGR